jgi:hypothetical protein
MTIVVDIAIPVLSILVPTIIAIWLARRERLGGDESRYLERRRQAAEPVILALAQFVSLDPLNEPLQSQLRDLRGRIAVYRASLRPADVLSGDWLALRHSSGMTMWADAVDLLQESGGNPQADLVNAAVDPGRRWANDTIEMFSSWLAGMTTDIALQHDGAILLEERTRRTDAGLAQPFEQREHDDDD